MIKDTAISQEWHAYVTLDPELTPKTRATGVQYEIKPDTLGATWVKSNGSKWILNKIKVGGRRILKGDVLSDSVRGARDWHGDPTGNYKIDPPSWVLSVIDEVKPNGWELGS